MQVLYMDSHYKRIQIVIIFSESKQSIASNMNSEGSSQSQASYLMTSSEKPSCQASSTELMDEQSAAAAMKALCARMLAAQNSEFDSCLKMLQVLILKGYCHLFMTQNLLMRKMMNHFTALGKHSDNELVQTKMLFTLSVIAEIIRENPKFYYPFTRKFLINVFEIDIELLRDSPVKNNILAILAVVYENLTRQNKLVRKYGIETRLKYVLLESYELVEEIFTLKMFNKALSNMVGKGVEISVADFHKYKVLETVSNFISKSQMGLFQIKMKMTMLLTTNPQRTGYTQ